MGYRSAKPSKLEGPPPYPVKWNIWNKDASRLLGKVTAQTAFEAYRNSGIQLPFSEVVMQQVPEK